MDQGYDQDEELYEASMRPQRIAAEYPRPADLARVLARRFKEAAADRCGIFNNGWLAKRFIGELQ